MDLFEAEGLVINITSLNGNISLHSNVYIYIKPAKFYFGENKRNIKERKFHMLRPKKMKKNITKIKYFILGYKTKTGFVSTEKSKRIAA